MISDEILLKVKEQLVDGFHPEKIILFGSQARGTAKKKRNSSEKHDLTNKTGHRNANGF